MVTVNPAKHKIDARFNKADIIRKIQLIYLYKSKINIFNLDAIEFLNTINFAAPQKTLINLDPPYYLKGQKLYQNFYTHDDHSYLSYLIPTIKPYWMITYDNVEPIRKLYCQFPHYEYKLSYTAQSRYHGKEILIVDPRLKFTPGKFMF